MGTAKTIKNPKQTKPCEISVGKSGEGGWLFGSTGCSQGQGLCGFDRIRKASHHSTASPQNSCALVISCCYCHHRDLTCP